ncbi:MAG: hypothetical protein WKG07_15915 [Hymenobacter sp.]
MAMNVDVEKVQVIERGAVSIHDEELLGQLRRMVDELALRFDEKSVSFSDDGRSVFNSNGALPNRLYSKEKPFQHEEIVAHFRSRLKPQYAHWAWTRPAMADLTELADFLGNSREPEKWVAILNAIVDKVSRLENLNPGLGQQDLLLAERRPAFNYRCGISQP